jgi:hypothetical protein
LRIGQGRGIENIVFTIELPSSPLILLPPNPGGLLKSELRTIEQTNSEVRMRKYFSILTSMVQMFLLKNIYFRGDASKRQRGKSFS